MDAFGMMLFIFGLVLTMNEELNIINLIGLALMIAACLMITKDRK